MHPMNPKINQMNLQVNQMNLQVNKMNLQVNRRNPSALVTADDKLDVKIYQILIISHIYSIKY